MYIDIKMGISVKTDAIVFQSSHVNWLFVPQASQIALIAELYLIFGLRLLRH